MEIYHTETQEDYDALIQTINKNIGSCQDHIETIMNENILERYLHKKHLAYWNGQIEAYQSMLMQIRLKKLPKGTQIINNSDDTVNSPNHYTQGELEVIDILQDKLTPQEFEGFLKGNILKYTFREGIKNGTEDMKKGAWYMSRLIDFRNEQEA